MTPVNSDTALMQIADRRTSYGWSKLDQLSSAPAVTIQPGASGYFSKPSSSLDPVLFAGDRLKPRVREDVLGLLYGYWGKFRDAESWSTVWLAGSAVSYQWNADREASGPGDLDCLVGVNMELFCYLHPDFRGLPDPEVAAILNDGLVHDLDPRTAHWRPHGARRAFELTFYVNPRAADIRYIQPYAAYNLTADAWTVEPIRLPVGGPSSWFPKEWWDAAHREHKQAEDVVRRYAGARSHVDTARPGSPQWVNAAASLRQAAEEASDLFDDIHTGRKQAFQPGAAGYRDWANFRWQAHKLDGSVNALHQIKNAVAAARIKEQGQLYGGALLDSDKALDLAVLAHSPYAKAIHAARLEDVT